MGIATLCSSHSPFAWDKGQDPAVGRGFIDNMLTLRQWVRDYSPELVIQFFPDHFNGFFFDAMPSFCIGTAAESIADWGTPPGPLQVPVDLAQQAVLAVRAADIDIAISHRMKVDHGCTQQLATLFDGKLDAYPVIPVMLNCVGSPLPGFRRVRQLGEALGRFALGTGKRVLFLGSGGLSHDPPVPNYAKAGPELRNTLISQGRDATDEQRLVREQRVRVAAHEFVAGRTSFVEPDAAWDRHVMDLVDAARLAEMDDWTEEAVTREGGCGGHEVRTWVAAFAAQRAAGPYEVDFSYYEIVRPWMTGMAIMRAAPGKQETR